MKRVKAIQHGVSPATPVSVPPSLLVAGLVLASINAQASVTPNGSYGNRGSISIREPGPIIPVIQSPAISLNAASASSTVSGNLNYQVGTRYGSFNEGDSRTDDSVAELELDRTGYGYQARALAQTGLARARAETESLAGSAHGDSYGRSSARATSSWSDWFVISGGAGPGEAGFASVLDGVMGSGRYGSAGYSLNIRYSAGAHCNYWCGGAGLNQTLFSQNSSLSGTGNSTLSQDVEGEFAFDYDRPFKLMVTLSVNAADGGVADFTLATLGDSLVLPQGAKLLSASGFPYVQAVPEAETYAMMLAGLGLVGWSTARRRAISK